MMRPRDVARLAMLALFAAVPPIGHLELIDSAWGQPARPAVRASPAPREQITLPRSRPAAARSHEAAAGEDADAVELPETFRELARGSGEPQIPGLTIVYLHPLGSPADANNWRNIIVHQTEGPPARRKAWRWGKRKIPPSAA
jgi:hypothetical protein